MTLSMTAADERTMKIWSTTDTRDAEKAMWFAPLISKGDDQTKGAPHIQEASKFQGMINMVTDFSEDEKKGDRVRLPHVAKVTGRGTHGDTIIQGSGNTQNQYYQDIFFENFAFPLVTPGQLAEMRNPLDVLKTFRVSLKNWYMRKMEEAFVLALWGLTSWNNTTILENWTAGSESQVFLNTIETFDTAAIVYAGDATSDATIDSADRLSAQELMRLVTVAKEDLATPVEPYRANGEDSYLLMTSARGCEDLWNDSEFRSSFTQVVPNANNPLTQRAKWKWQGIYIAEYGNCLNPAANVCRSILTGANALHYARVKPMQYFQDFADWAKRRTALTVTAACGVKANKVGASGSATRRNAVAIDHYSRT